MKTCKTCSHWNVKIAIVDGISDCNRVSKPTESNKQFKTAIYLSKVTDETVDIIKSKKLQVILLTGFDFGCIHHKLK